MDEIIKYIIRFLIGEDQSEDYCRFVGYTADRAAFHDYKVVIESSDFFYEETYGTEKTMPQLPLQIIEGIPFLYGTSEKERVDETIVVHADIIASSYFLISRYEEFIHRNLRDEHGRFSGKKSLPYLANFIDMPIVDEYGKLLRKWLRDSGVDINEPINSIKKVYLTHDVDSPFFGRTWRNVVRRILKGTNPITAIRDKFAPLEQDYYYTFPEIFRYDNAFRNSKTDCTEIYFFKSGGDTLQDKPHYKLQSGDCKKLLSLCKKNGAIIGMHSSYAAGKNPALIASEKQNLENAFGIKITANRHHYLSSREPEDMEVLEQVGITDDFTMGYADYAGFRLGTSRKVRYINPATRRLSKTLFLHPLTVMDCTLDRSHYMNLTKEQAFEYCRKLFLNINRSNGEINLLWHNTEFVGGNNYLGGLYEDLLQNILTI